VTRTAGRVALWAVFAAAVLLLGVYVFALAGPRIDPAEVRRVCATYANLDLSELAPLCVQAGYQQLDPTASWPYVSRVVHPEDLDR
jgi:hypothetical protein